MLSIESNDRCPFFLSKSFIWNAIIFLNVHLYAYVITNYLTHKSKIEYSVGDIVVSRAAFQVWVDIVGGGTLSQACIFKEKHFVSAVDATHMHFSENLLNIKYSSISLKYNYKRSGHTFT